MNEKEKLKLFEREKKLEELMKEIGNDTAINIFSELIQEGFIEETKKGFYKLTKSAKNNLDNLSKQEKNKNKKEFFKHPLALVIISVVLTAFFTYLITIHITNVENELSVKFIGENELIVPPNQTISFNGITIYNPTNKKVSLKNLYVERESNWIKYQPLSNDGATNLNQSEVIYNIPDLIEEYEPYMVLESGETKLMSGQFNLMTPYEEGTYELNFYVETLDGKKYYIDRKLIVEVKIS